MTIYGKKTLISLRNLRVTTVWKVSVFGVYQARIFRPLDWIRRGTEFLSVFSRNAGKYGPEKLRTRTHFRQWTYWSSGEKWIRNEAEMVHEITISIEFLLIPGSALVYNYNIWYLIIISDVVLTSSCKEVYVT